MLFDAFEVRTGSGVSSATSDCQLAVPLLLPAGSIGVYKVDYRGFVQLAAEDTVELLITHAAGEDRLAITGAYQDDVSFTDTIASSRTGTLNAEVRLTLRSADVQAEASAVLDSIDVAEIGFTSLQSVSDSVARIAEQRTALSTHLGTSASMLLGFDQRVDAATEVGVVAASGATTVGANARWRSDTGLTLSGGAAYVRQSVGDVDLRGSALLAAAIRYVQPGTGSLRPFAELAAWGSPELDTAFGRHYLNGAATSDTTASLLAGSLRVGALYTPRGPGGHADADEIAVSLSLAGSWLHVDGYAESQSTGNLFPVAVDGDSTSTRALKASIAWSGALGEALDFTLAAAGGRTLGGGARVRADVDWIGRVSEASDSVSFVEYAGRVGYRINSRTTLDAFVFGSRGSRIGSETRVGAAIRIAL